MKTIIFIALLVLFILSGVILFFNWQKFFPPKKIHYHAGFQVYVEGKMQDFSDVKYMDLQPCTENNLTIDQQEAKAHLHEGIGDVVHVHREHVVWQDLFTNMHFPIDASKGVDGYINGEKVPNILQFPIKPYDILILFIGKHDPIQSYLPHAVTVAHIKQIEKTSELCGS